MPQRRRVCGSWKEGQAPPEGWLISWNEQGGCKCIRQTARDGLGWPEASESPNLILCTWAIEGGREGSFIYLLSLNIILEYLTDLRKRMTLLNSFHLLQWGPVLAQSGNTREPGQSPPQKSASEHLPRCRFSLIDILALETRSWLLSHFRISFWGSWNTCPPDRLPLRIWARLTGSSALTNDGIDGQNKEEHTKKHFCLVWCVSKPSSSGCWRYILLHASLHSNGIPRQSCFFHDTRQQAALWALGPPSLEEGAALKSCHFQKCLKLVFLLSWI